MDFVVTDREGIEAGVPVRGPYVVISIHDPDSPEPRVRRQTGLRGVLRLAFDDAEPTDLAGLAPASVLMTAEQAAEIWRFVGEHAGAVRAVVVHCEAGWSRSPAVAAALCAATGGDEGRFWRDYSPNVYVYQLVLAAAADDGEGGR